MTVIRVTQQRTAQTTRQVGDEWPADRIQVGRDNVSPSSKANADEHLKPESSGSKVSRGRDKGRSEAARTLVGTVVTSVS